MAIIGILDSGIGGLCILKAIDEVKAGNTIYYLADNLNCPYGSKNQKEIKQTLKYCCDIFVSLGVEAIILACNTATSEIQFLRKEYEIKFFGLEPAIMPAIRSNCTKIQVIATPYTINSNKYNLLTKNYKNKIINSPQKDLAKLIELNAPNYDNLYSTIKEILIEDIDSIVLGCTHYVLIKDIIKQIKPNLKIFDSTDAIKNHVIKTLNMVDLQINNKLYFLHTGNDESYKYENILKYI